MKRLTQIMTSLMLTIVMLLAGCGGKSGSGSAAVESVELSRATLALEVGEEETLTYTVLPSSAAGAEARWVTSDGKVATVEAGKVTGVGEGSAAIRLTVGGKSATCNVTVSDPNKGGALATGVELDRRTLSLKAGESAKLSAKLEPENAKSALKWQSSQEQVATVTDGEVKAVGGGTAVITATTENNVSGYCVVQVAGAEAEGAGGLYVGKVSALEGRKTPFIMAMDSSELISVEEARSSSGLTFKDFDGKPVEDVLTVLKDNGITDIRIRVWNDPRDESGHSYGGGNCDTENAVKLSERCKAAGLGVIIDFHYSDFWADPGKQKAPKAWQGKSAAQVEELLYSFTKDSLEKIKATGVTVTMVQIGNETTGGLAGASDESTVFGYMKQGSKAVRETLPTAKVAVHYTNAGNGDYVSRARKLADAGVDYDVFGTSWYPYYSSHGTLANLSTQLKNVHEQYGKEVMVLETAYAFTYEDYDGCGNTALDTTTQPVTVQGMSNAVREVIAAIAELGDYGLGIAYWGGTWVAASEKTDGATNRALCKEYGCGWATSYARGYDADANDGGSMVDNNAFFRSDGSPIEALKVFKEVYEGHTTNIHADYLEDQEVYYTVSEGSVQLPDTVEVVLNNGSRQTVKAYWAVEKADLEGYIDRVDTYDVKGTTLYGGECHVYVWVMNVNLLSEGSFEGFKAYGDSTTKFVQGDLGRWKPDITNSNTGDLQLFVSNNTGNARLGEKSFHFWDSGVVKFTLSQTLTAEELKEYGAGKYGCSFDVQGGDGTDVDVHAYITVKYKDGSEKTFEGNKVGLDGWQIWNRTSVSGAEIDPDKVESVTIGIRVYAAVAGNGPWGNIDNAQFYFEA